jgi:hypothetical protein
VSSLPICPLAPIIRIISLIAEVKLKSKTKVINLSIRNYILIKLLLHNFWLFFEGFLGFLKVLSVADNLCIFTILNAMAKYIYFLACLLFVISCGDNKETEKAKKPKPLMGVVYKHKATENVNPRYVTAIKDWKELKAIDSFFVRYRNITPNEALSNAVELKDLIKHLIDSVQPEHFKTPAFNARVNILYNEVLRLVDLTEIAAVKPNEVNTQVSKTMLAFSSVNIKINTVVAKLNFEDEIEIKVDFIGLDTSRLEAVSRKEVYIKRETSENTKENAAGLNKKDKSIFIKKEPLSKFQDVETKEGKKETLFQTKKADKSTAASDQ